MFIDLTALVQAGSSKFETRNKNAPFHTNAITKGDGEREHILI